MTGVYGMLGLYMQLTQLFIILSFRSCYTLLTQSRFQLSVERLDVAKQLRSALQTILSHSLVFESQVGDVCVVVIVQNVVQVKMICYMLQCVFILLSFLFVVKIVLSANINILFTIFATFCGGLIKKINMHTPHPPPTLSLTQPYPVTIPFPQTILFFLTLI